MEDNCFVILTLNWQENEPELQCASVFGVEIVITDDFDSEASNSKNFKFRLN